MTLVEHIDYRFQQIERGLIEQLTQLFYTLKERYHQIGQRAYVFPNLDDKSMLYSITNKTYYLYHLAEILGNEISVPPSYRSCWCHQNKTG